MRKSSTSASTILTGTPKPKPAFSWDDFESLRAANGMTEDDVPAGALTLAQYAELSHVGLPTADDQLKRLVESGKMCRGRKRTLGRGGRTVTMWHYWPAE